MSVQNSFFVEQNQRHHNLSRARVVQNDFVGEYINYLANFDKNGEQVQTYSGSVFMVFRSDSSSAKECMM